MPVASPIVMKFEYVLECDRALPPEKQTRFLLRRLTWSEDQEIKRTEWKRNKDGDSVYSLDVYGRARRILDCGLEGWVNFNDADGRSVEFSRVEKALSDETLERIRPYAFEIANAITAASEQSEEDSKNSGSP